jgi:hypothetical protein
METKRKRTKRAFLVDSGPLEKLNFTYVTCQLTRISLLTLICAKEIKSSLSWLTTLVPEHRINAEVTIRRLQRDIPNFRIYCSTIN